MRSLSLFFLLLFSSLSPVAAQVVLNSTPTRVIGQDSLNVTSYAPNLVEGRELDSPLGIALDVSANPPHLYVADTGNNRVLGWANAASFANGQKADIVVGQADFVTTLSQGPNRGTTPRTTGLTSPVGIAVDPSGNLYVDDCGNNRILRFPKPFIQTSILPDMVLGQSDFNHNGANGTSGTLSATSLSLNLNNNVYTAYLAFDPSGDLWAADPGNNRVLRYDAATLSKGASGAVATLVLGQADFVSNNVSGYSVTSLTTLLTPAGIAVDSNNNVFVAESTNNALGRVLVYVAPNQNGQAAARLIGEPSTSQTTQVNASQLGVAPAGIAIVNNGLAVADSANNRIVLYAPVSQWTADTGTQVAIAVVGQPDLMSGSANQGQPESSASTLSGPGGLAASSTELFVADTGNHRALIFPASGSSFAAATRVLGQDAMNYNTVNLIEGKELRFTTSVIGNSQADGGIVIDTLSSPPHLYIADTYNNRVLGFKDARGVHPGTKADIVIGQPNFSLSEYNYPSNDPTMPNQSGLSSPVGVAVDIHGNLYVADSGNGRVLRFPTPFANPQNMPNADIVIGQQNFTLKITDASPSTLNTPYGLAFAGDTGLLVSDTAHERVLFFPGASANFQSGMSATKVFGQPDFTTTSTGNTNDKLNGPRHIATDSTNRLYVTDFYNQRVSIFDNVDNAGADPQAAITINGISPYGIYVNPTLGDIWVGDSSAHVYHYPAYDALTLSNLQPDYNFAEAGSVLAVTQDASGSLYVADSLNRVVIHFPGLAGINAANYIVGRALSPGTIASLFTLSNQANFFSSTSASAYQLPIPTTLGDTQVTVNDVLSPVYYVGAGQVNFLVPNEAPVSGTATIEVVRASTGQVLGSGIIPMAPSSPGLFTLTATGSGQVAAVNQDNTINGPSNPAPWGSIVAFYGTGMGMVPNAPPDGAAATGPTPTTSTPQVVIGSAFVPSGYVKYSGLAPGLVGVWQVNVQIPNTVPPTTTSAPTPVFFLLDSIPSGGPVFNRSVTMWVKSN